MRVLIPYAPDDPKTRLAGVLSPEERETFSEAMLEDVLTCVTEAGHVPRILATRELPAISAPVRVDDRPLSTAINASLDPPMAVVMADMPLVTPGVLSDAFDRAGDVVIGPGRGGGTNLLVIRDDRFAVDYHGASLVDHRRTAATAGLSVEEIDSFRIAVDVDEPEDLVEVLLHGEGHAAAWLEAQGFELAETAGRVVATRH